jgi:hypothetical protein
MSDACVVNRDAKWAIVDTLATFALLAVLLIKPNVWWWLLMWAWAAPYLPTSPPGEKIARSPQRQHQAAGVTGSDSTEAQTVKAPWRTGDVALPLLAVAYLVASLAILALAASGSWFGVVGAALIVSAELALIIEWAGAPFDPELTTAPVVTPTPNSPIPSRSCDTEPRG